MTGVVSIRGFEAPTVEAWRELRVEKDEQICARDARIGAPDKRLAALEERLSGDFVQMNTGGSVGMRPAAVEADIWACL
jgi:hypothetical protein